MKVGYEDKRDINESGSHYLQCSSVLIWKTELYVIKLEKSVSVEETVSLCY